MPSSGLAITYTRMGREPEAQNTLAQLLQARENRYVSAPLIAAVFRRAWRQRRSFSLTRTGLRGTLGGATVDRISSRVSCAPFRRSFSSAFTANQRFAGRNFDDHRDNSVRDGRSEGGESFHSQNWSKVAITYAKWPACEDCRLLLRPDER